MLNDLYKNFICILLLLSCTQSLASATEGLIYSYRTVEAIKLLKDKYPNNEPGLSYLIAHKGKVLASGGIGIANMDWNISLTDKTLLRLGSISKSITSIAVLKLVEEGKLDLDVPISTYATELPNLMGMPTLRQLLSHRSGLADHAFDKELIP